MIAYFSPNGRLDDRWFTNQHIRKLIDHLESDGVRITTAKYNSEQIQRPPFYPNFYTKRAAIYGRTPKNERISVELVNWSRTDSHTEVAILIDTRVPQSYISRFDEIMDEVFSE